MTSRRREDINYRAHVKESLDPQKTPLATPLIGMILLIVLPQCDGVTINGKFSTNQNDSSEMVITI